MGLDAPLSAIAAVLVPMRHQPEDDGSPGRGVTPELRQAEAMLRDWIESELDAYPADGDAGAFARKLNQRRRKADLLCSAAGDAAADRCGDGHALGYLAAVKLDRVDQGRLLLLKLGAGVGCDFDNVAALYAQDGGRWRRIWEGGPEAPDAIDVAGEIEVSPPREDGERDRLVLAYGFAFGCASFWHDVNYRLWRVPADGSGQTLLLDRDEEAYIDPPMEGRVGPGDALVEFTTTALEAGFTRQAVRHYRVDGTRVERLEPIGLNPVNFVTEWITAPWRESHRWTLPAVRRRLYAWRRQNGEDWVGTSAITRRCRGNANLWQVGDPGDRIYFLLRWRPPYHFEIADVDERPWRRCMLKDPAADEYRSLFPPPLFER